MLLLLLLWLLFVGMLVLVFLLLLFLLGLLLNHAHVLVVDVPLRDCAAEPSCGRRLGRPTPFTEDAILGLRRSLREVELISQRVLDGHLLGIFRRLKILVHCLFLFAPLLLLLLLVLNFHLVLGLWALFQQDGTVHGKVEHNVLHLVVFLEGPLLIGVGRQVRRCPGVIRVQDARRDLFFKLFRAQRELVLGFHLDDDGHVVLLHGLLLGCLAPSRLDRRRPRRRPRLRRFGSSLGRHCCPAALGQQARCGAPRDPSSARRRTWPDAAKAVLSRQEATP
mmetsp:Transcript_102437/g.330476  ORF Transcript_102437/g.330476 Transcript_102437/m.330476 type:complete len:279 (+) Transcript_102437:1423-2259(+)